MEILEIGTKLRKLNQFDFVLIKLLLVENNVMRAELTKGVERLHELYGFRVPFQGEFTLRLQLLEELGFITKTRGQTCVYSVKEEYKFCLLNLTGAYFEIWGKLKGGV